MKTITVLILIFAASQLAGCANPFRPKDDTNTINYVLPRFETHQKPVIFKDSLQ